MGRTVQQASEFAWIRNVPQSHLWAEKKNRISVTDIQGNIMSDCRQMIGIGNDKPVSSAVVKRISKETYIHRSSSPV
jgi:hypothetical protein